MHSKVLAVLAVAAFASANDLHQGLNNTEGLIPVFKEHFVEDWTYFSKTTKEVFVNASSAITAVNVTDLRPGKDGDANIISGGIGHDNVTISLKSPTALRGFDFMVEVFADEKEIERGSRGVEDPENKTTEPVSTSTTGKPMASSLATGKTDPDVVTGVPTGTPETGYSTGKPMPKMDMEIPEEQLPVKVKIGFQ